MIFLEVFLETVFGLLGTSVFIHFLACIFMTFCFAGLMMFAHVLCTATGGDDD